MDARRTNRGAALLGSGPHRLLPLPPPTAFADEAPIRSSATCGHWRRRHCWSRVEDPMGPRSPGSGNGGSSTVAGPPSRGRASTVAAAPRWWSAGSSSRRSTRWARRRPPPQSYVKLIGPALLRRRAGAARPLPGPNGERRRALVPGLLSPEPAADLAGLRTKAERRGDEYVVNSQKVWTSHADIADWCFLLAAPSPTSRNTRGSACCWST